MLASQFIAVGRAARGVMNGESTVESMKAAMTSSVLVVGHRVRIAAKPETDFVLLTDGQSRDRLAE